MLRSLRFFILRLFCLFVACVHASIAWGQSNDIQQKMDSLQQLIPALQGEERLEAYLELQTYIFYYEQDTEDRKSVV